MILYALEDDPTLLFIILMLLILGLAIAFIHIFKMHDFKILFFVFAMLCVFLYFAGVVSLAIGSIGFVLFAGIAITTYRETGSEEE